MPTSTATSAGSFLGEYQAGGTIIVLGLDRDEGVPCGSYLGTGMHGNAQTFLRCEEEPEVNEFLEVEKLTGEGLAPILEYLKRYADLFDISLQKITEKPFWKISPGDKNPFDSLYTPY